MGIRPTLFIGLGSSGCHMIKEFRRFMYEQFSMAGLPIFRYIGLETDADYDVGDSLLPDSFSLESYENLQLVLCTIAGSRDVKKIDNPELRKWMDEKLMSEDAWQVTRGAGTVRMNGRLALWMNWKGIEAAITNASEQIRKTDRIEQTRKILEERAGGQFQQASMEPGYDVYLLGTLCGGTCGGMFIDLAYQVQRLLHVGAVHVPDGTKPDTPGIYGIFTIVDSALARLEINRRKAANCWASLLELDYYMDPDTGEYDYRLPGVPDEEVASTNSPFSIVQLVSRQNLLNKSFHCDDLAKYTGEDLNKMIALKIFNNMFSGLDREIAAATIDLVGNAIVGDEDRNENLRTKTLISFGVSALWNPRYLFAEAFASHEGKALCAHWGESFDPARSTAIKKTAEDKWGEIRNAGLAMMMHVPHGPHVQEEIDKAVKGAKRFLEPQSLAKLPRFLENVPQNNPVRRRLEEGGDLWGVMTQQVSNAKRFMTENVQRLLGQKVEEIPPPGAPAGDALESLRAVKEFIKHLKNAVATDMEGCPTSPAPWHYEPLRIPPYVEEYVKSTWLRMLGVAKMGLPGVKLRVLEDFEIQLDSFMKATRKFFVRPVLQELLDVHIPAFEEGVDKAVANLREARVQLEEHLEYVKKLTETSFDNILEIAPYPTVEKYVESLSDGFRRLGEQHAVVEGIREQWKKSDKNATDKWLDLFALPPEKTAELVRSSYSRWALKQPSGTIDLPKEALKRHGNSDRLEDLARRSYPFVLMEAGYVPTQHPKAVDHICGDGSIDDLVNHVLARANISFKKYESKLSNMAIFYRELAPFYADDMSVAGVMSKRYTEFEGKNIHTHLKQGEEFDKVLAREKVAVRDKLWAVRELYGDEVFEPNRKLNPTKWTFKYVGPGNRPVPAVDVTSDNDRRTFCQLLAKQDPLSRAARSKFDKDVENLLREKGEDHVKKRWQEALDLWKIQLDKKEISLREYQRRQKAVEGLYDEVFGEADEGSEGA